MNRIIIFIIILVFAKNIFAGTTMILAKDPPIGQSIEKKKLPPCVSAFLNEKLINGKGVSQDAEGTLTVENNDDQKIYFNLTLKTNLNKKNEPPIYLRFIKVSNLDIRRVLDYAKIGDEVYIEQFVGTSGATINCAPSSFIVT